MPITRRSTAMTTLALAAAATLAACGGDAGTADSARADSGMMAPAADTGMMAPGTAAGTGMMLSDPSTGPQVDSIVTAARGGLTSVPPAVAVGLIQRLEDKLDNSNDPALTDIAKDLEALREELSDDTPDGGDIANILERLGPKVTNVAGNAGPMSGALQELGRQLSQGATQLRGR